MQRIKALLAERDSASRDDLFKAVCLDCSEALDADLVSIWTFDEQLTHIECQCCYDALKNECSDGQVLLRTDFPRYFQTIVEENLINAAQARSLQVTSELTKPYFEPNGILSLLDFILHQDFKPTGVICCENRREVRNWTKSDETYLRSVASLTSFLFKPSKP